MNRFLMIVPEAVAPAGLIGPALLQSGAAYDCVMPVAEYASYSPLAYPGLPLSPMDYAGLIVLGGPMSATEEAEHPFLKRVMTLIRQFTDLERPVLGICLGAQIIARAFGGKVYRMDRLESGFFEMQLTEAGRSDPVFAGLQSSFFAFHNHYEAVRDVPDSVTLVTGGACAVQAFRRGRATYGLQFHPEVTLDIVRDWVRLFGETFGRDEPKLLSDLDRQFASHFAEASALCQILTQRWAGLADAGS